MVAPAKRAFSKADLDALLDRAIEANGSVIIRRPGRRDLAIVSVERLRDLDTTDYLFASPANRRRLLGALRDARADKGRSMTLGQLRKRVGLEK